MSQIISPCACGFPKPDLMLFANQYSRKCPRFGCYAHTPSYATRDEADASWNRMVRLSVPLNHVEMALEMAFKLSCESTSWSEWDKESARRVISFVRAQLTSDGVKPLSPV
jgi:hypothetical protein